MGPGDLVQMRTNYAGTSVLDSTERFRFAFTMTWNDIGIVIHPNDHSYVKVLMRGQVVWVSPGAVRVVP